MAKNVVITGATSGIGEAKVVACNSQFFLKLL